LSFRTNADHATPISTSKTKQKLETQNDRRSDLVQSNAPVQHDSLKSEDLAAPYADSANKTKSRDTKAAVSRRVLSFFATDEKFGKSIPHSSADLTQITAHWNREY